MGVPLVGVDVSESSMALIHGTFDVNTSLRPRSAASHAFVPGPLENWRASCALPDRAELSL